MADPEGTRELKAGVYVHDKTRLLYVLDIVEGSVLVEDAFTGNALMLDPEKLEGFTVMERA